MDEFCVRSVMFRYFFAFLMMVSLHAADAVPPLYPFQNSVRAMPAEDGVALLKELGYPGIGSVYPQDLAKYQAACEKNGLKVFSIYCTVKVHKTGFTYDAKIPAAIASLKGTDAIVELNIHRGDDPQEVHVLNLVKQVAADAKAAGLRVILYPHATDCVERVDQALRIAKASGCDNVGIAFNLCHFLKVQPGDDFAQTIAAAKDRLWSVSICGADRDGKDWTTLIRPLDEGSVDQSALLRLLKENGYHGPIGLQCYNIRLAPRDHLARSLAKWKSLQVKESAK
jgi:sugar phosphate isomerase/epimerase